MEIPCMSCRSLSPRCVAALKALKQQRIWRVPKVASPAPAVSFPTNPLRRSEPNRGAPKEVFPEIMGVYCDPAAHIACSSATCLWKKRVEWMPRPRQMNVREIGRRGIFSDGEQKVRSVDDTICERVAGQPAFDQVVKQVRPWQIGRPDGLRGMKQCLAGVVAKWDVSATGC